VRPGSTPEVRTSYQTELRVTNLEDLPPELRERVREQLEGTPRKVRVGCALLVAAAALLVMFNYHVWRNAVASCVLNGDPTRDDVLVVGLGTASDRACYAAEVLRYFRPREFFEELRKSLALGKIAPQSRAW
jgi:hypothetical protein